VSTLILNQTAGATTLAERTAGLTFETADRRFSTFAELGRFLLA
jgi:hypothetical protein